MTEAALIEAIYEAPLDREHPWTAFLDRYRNAVRSHSAQLMFARPEPGSPRGSIDALERSFSGARRAYYAGFEAQNPIRYERLAVGRITTFEDFTSRAEFERSSFYLQFGREHGVEHGLALTIGMVGGLGVWLNTSRGGARDYSAGERKLTARLAPHLRRVLRLNPGFGRYRHVEAEADVGRDRDAGVLFLNEAGLVIDADGRAETILAGHACVSRRGKTLHFADRDMRMRFARRLAELGEAPQRAVRALACGCPHARLELLIERSGGVTPQLLVHLRAGPTPAIRPDLLCDLFGLSPSEAAVALLLAQGKDLAGIAAARGLTEQSARTYCKRIFAKTGVGRQAELVALVLNSVAGLAPCP